MTCRSEPMLFAGLFLLIENRSEDRGKVEQHRHFFLLDQIRRLGGVELAHVEVEHAGVEGHGGHEQPAHVEERQDVEMHVSG